MNFHSDNWAGAHPAIAQSLLKHSSGMAGAYGSSKVDQKVADTFNDLFEREVSVFFVATGTAANALALSAVNRPGGICFCHSEAHLAKDEGGAPEFLASGARLQTVAGEAGKIAPDRLRRALGQLRPDFVHAGQAMAVSVTQATEVGTLYTPSEIEALAEISHQNGLPLHMDGARFANALATLDLTPAEMTWRCGVDLLSFGGTKNGCWCAEALIVLDPKLADDLPYLRKRAAQLFSKSRFIAAQFEAYLAEDLWLESARHANQLASELAHLLAGQPGIRLAYPPEANEVFAITSERHFHELTGAGVGCYQWPTPADRVHELAADEVMLRFVTSFASTREDIAGLKRVFSRESSSPSRELP